MWILVCATLSAVVAVLALIPVSEKAAAVGAVLFAVAANGAYLVVGVRRLHDIDKSGWWILFALVPFINLALLLAQLFRPGTPGSNRFGAPPSKLSFPDSNRSV